MSNTQKTPSYKVQAIVEGASPWPYLGNAYANKDGSLTIVLDRGVALRLADGTVLEATAPEGDDDARPRKVRLMVRKAFHMAPEHAANIAF